MIVGTTITSMMPRALSRIFASAAPIGPCASSTLPEQPLSERKRISPAGIRHDRGRCCKNSVAFDEMDCGGCMKASISCAELASSSLSGLLNVTGNPVDPQPPRTAWRMTSAASCSLRTMGTDDEPAYQQLGQAGEDSIEVTVGTDVEDIKFEPEGVSRRRSAARCPAAGLRSIGI